MSGLSSFRSVRAVGTVLPAEALTSGAELRMPGQAAADYQLPPGMTVGAAVARAWEAMLATHREWRSALARLPEQDAATKVTREKWLLPLLYELGWGRPEVVSGGLDIAPGLGESAATHFPISHRLSWPDAATPSTWVPLHLVGAGIDLDTKTTGHTARAPQSMIQDYLNREHRALWAVLSNGHTLRLLRDASALARQSYVEFDLDDIFTNQRYADFRLLFLTLHASRFVPQIDAGTHAAEQHSLDPSPATQTCWLEQWRTTSIKDGVRALDNLRTGVARALEQLGTGFVSHAGNHKLRQLLENSPTADRDLHRALLRVAYRFIVLFVAEDRDLLHPPSARHEAVLLYSQYFSTSRLRRMASQWNGTRHTDLWQSHLIVADALSGDGLESLGLHSLGVDLFDSDLLGVLRDSELPNRHLLGAIRALSEIEDPTSRISRPVDYRNLDSEELGGIYEGLLAYDPHYDPLARTFRFREVPGSERKTSGSFYTSAPLIDLVLSDSLDPVINEALCSNNPEKSLLGLTVCDPACGSGHFLVAAARRIARALASVRTGDPEPPAGDVRAALADTVQHCIYGVDSNDLAIDIAKVALWLESIQPGRPLAFLESHLRVGNALLGTTAELVRLNVPDEAFTAVQGDDKKVCTELRKKNKQQRESGQLGLFADELHATPKDIISKTALELESALSGEFADIQARADAWRRHTQDEDLSRAKLIADAWCTAFLQPKVSASTPAITHETLTQLQDDPSSVSDEKHTLIERTARRYKLFHWDLEFPGIFTQRTIGGTVRPPGFSVMIGNPPWETLSPDTREFFGNLVPGIRAMSKAEKDRQISDLLKDPNYSERWQDHQRDLFATAHFLKHSGRYSMYAPGNLGKGDFNVYRSFAELALTYTATGGYVGQVTPSGIYSGANASAIRRNILEDCTWISVYGFDNKGGSWFPGVTLENFGAYTVRVGVVPDSDHSIRAAFGMHKPDDLSSDLASRTIDFPAIDVIEQNPDTFAVPAISEPRAARLSHSLYRRFPRFGEVIEGLPYRDFCREIDMSDKDDVFAEDGPGAPIYEGRMIDFYDHRAKRYVSGHGNSSVWEPTDFGSSRKTVFPQWYVTQQDLPNDAVRNRIQHYRIGFMDVADPGRQRSFVSAIVPPGTACGDKVPTLLFDAEWYRPVYLAIANSLVIDFLVRQRVMSKKMALNILDSMPIARLSKDDARSRWLAVKALTLTCTSADMNPFWNSFAQLGWVEEFGTGSIPGECDPEARRRIRAEIDAFVATEIYELKRPEIELILDSFTQLCGIEVKTHGEFRTRSLVLDSYERRPWIRDLERFERDSRSSVPSPA